MKSEHSSSSLEDNLGQHQLVTSSSSSSEPFAQADEARNGSKIATDNMNICSQNHLSSYSEDNNQMSNQEEEILSPSHKSQKSKSKGNCNDNEQKEQGVPLMRSSRKIKKDYRNLSLASKYEMEEQNEIQNSASKKKKLTNSATKSNKKKKSENESATSNQSSFSNGQQQQQHSRNQSYSTSNNSQTSPHVKQFKNSILESFQKCKSQLPPKMLSFISKQTLINLNTVAKVNVRLPKNDEYPESINNIQKVLADQEQIIKELVGAQSNQSLFDFLTKQKNTKKEQLIHQQYLAKQKQEQINKDNIEQLKQNLQYKINPQFIKSELKKELKHLKQSNESQIISGKQSPHSYSQYNSSQSQHHSKEQVQHPSFEMEVEKIQEQINISTELSTTKNKINDSQQISEINNKNNNSQIANKSQLELKRNPSQLSKKEENEQNEIVGITTSAQEPQSGTRKNSGSTRSSEEPQFLSKKQSQNNSCQNTASSTPTASQIMPNHTYVQSPHQQQAQNPPHPGQQYGNIMYQRHPLKQQMLHYPHPIQQHPEGYLMYHPAAGYPYQPQPHPHFNQRYWEQQQALNGQKPHAKFYTQSSENIHNQSAASHNNNIQTTPDSLSAEQTTTSLYQSGENQENIYHTNPNITYYNQHPNQQGGYNQNIHPSHHYPTQYPYDSHSMIKRDQQVLSNSMRINRNGNHPPVYQHHYPQTPSSNTPYPIQDYQNNLGTNFSTDFNEQDNLTYEPQPQIQQQGYHPGYNSNEKDQIASNNSTLKREDFFNDLDDAFEDSLSNFNMKPYNGSKRRKGMFDNDLEMEMQDHYSQNLMDFN